jgi:glycerol-3-phosphate dehydrogenase
LVRQRGSEADRHGLPADLYAELLYGIEAEMVVHPADFLVRRTGMLYFDIAGVQRWKDGIIACMAEVLGWDDERRQHMTVELEQQIEQAVHPAARDSDNRVAGAEPQSPGTPVHSD